jgi:hypothetical protein
MFPVCQHNGRIIFRFYQVHFKMNHYRIA